MRISVQNLSPLNSPTKWTKPLFPSSYCGCSQLHLRTQDLLLPMTSSHSSTACGCWSRSGRSSTPPCSSMKKLSSVHSRSCPTTFYRLCDSKVLFSSSASPHPSSPLSCSKSLIDWTLPMLNSECVYCQMTLTR